MTPSLLDYVEIIPHDPPLSVGEVVYPLIGGTTQLHVVRLLDDDRVQITWENPDGAAYDIDVASTFCLRSPSEFSVAELYGEFEQ